MIYIHGFSVIDYIEVMLGLNFEMKRDSVSLL